MNDRRRPLTIGLLGLYRCGNFGDEAIWRAFVGAVRPLLPAGSRLTMITLGPAGWEAKHLPENDEQKIDELLHHLALDAPLARRLRWWHWLNRGWPLLKRQIDELDALWYAGGHWIHDLSLRTLAGVLAPIRYAHKRGINAGFVNVGAGPLDTTFGHILTRRAVAGPGPLIVRDAHSAEVLAAADVPRTVTVCEDTAHLLQPADADAVDAAWRVSNLPTDRPAVGIVPCAWFKMDDLYRPQRARVEAMVAALAAEAHRLAKRGLATVLIPTMLPEDEIVARQILSRLGDGPYYLLDTRLLPARTLMGLIGRLRALISFRMHPLLFACRMRTPLVALDYAPKVNSLVHQFNLERWLTPLDDHWPKALAEKMDRLLADPDPLREACPADRLAARALAGVQQAVATLK